MSSKKYLPLLCIFLMVSCKKSPVVFTEAQPEKTKDENIFPKHLMGEYYNLEQHVVLKITDRLIEKTMVLKDTFSLKDLSKEEKLINDTIINKQTSERFVVKKINDSLFTNYVFKDTVFFLNTTNVLRKWRGYYFLNSKNSDNTWVVQKLFLKKGQLGINGISTKEEIAMLAQITNTSMDSIPPFLVKPSKKQFKTFVKSNGFSVGEVYIKK